ncbi:MAG: membrane protein insertase YidC [Alphaproteobacteria bacterium]
MPEQRNLILAIVLSVTIIIGFQYFYEMPRIQDQQRRQAAVEESTGSSTTPAPATTGSATTSSPAVPGSVPTGQPVEASRESVLAAGERIAIDNGRLTGSIGLTGARIDDIVMTDYKVSIAPNADNVTLFNPAGSPNAYFAEFGWTPEGDGIVVPDQETVWSTDRKELRPDQPVTLSWENGQGLIFERKLTIDDNYLITVTQRVRNQGEESVTLHSYGLVRRWGTPKISGFYILHEGPIGILDGQLTEVDYKDLVEDGAVELKSNGGWLGITDKYWLAALIPDQETELTTKFQHFLSDGKDRYQSDYLRPAITVPAGGSAEVTDRLFAGAKEVQLLDSYAAEYNIPLFDRAVDFGWFYWLTKPIFHTLHFFYQLVGNYGIAILMLTLLVKILFFPLANKSYRSMSAMKKLQPEMTRIREQAGDDKMRMQKEMMELYKKEKVNPMSGCLPIVVQIPVFFSLYKVLFVSIEMRHAPFFGWIHDLSAPDPTSFINLFGLLPFDPPSFLAIGIWPLLMGLTMFLQTKLNPQPADPVQAKVMLFLPLMFIFLFATFAAGLVIYWTWNNILSITQQWVIMRRMGVKVT